MKTIETPPRGKRCRFDHSREALMQQRLTIYKNLVGSPYNPRNSPGSKSPYPKSPPMINKSYPRNLDNSLNVNYNPPLHNRDSIAPPTLAIHNTPTTPLSSN